MVSDSLGPHELQHTKLLYPLLSLGVCSNSCPLSQWCYLTISSSATPFSSCLSFRASVYFNEPALRIRKPKYWSFSFSISPFNEYSGLISFRIYWFDFLLKSLLQHYNLKASVLRHSAFFMVQLSHPYVTTGKTIVLTIWLVGKVMSLLFNTLSGFVIALVSRSNCLLILWLQSPSAVILEPKKITSVTVNYLTLKFNPFASFSRYLSYSHNLQQGYKMLLDTVKVFFSLFTHP